MSDNEQQMKGENSEREKGEGIEKNALVNVTV